MARSNFDVAVFGGGPAGSTTAMLLARSGVSVLLLESSDYSEPRRGETLSPRVMQQLRSLAMDQAFHDLEPVPTPGIVSVWGSGEPSVNDFFSGIKGHAWQVDRSAFDRMMAIGANTAGALLRSKSRLEGTPEPIKDGWQFEFVCQGSTSFCKSRFFVDATGRSGSPWLSRFSERTVIDRLVGIIYVGNQLCELPYMSVESVDLGWFYSADLPARRTLVAYFTDSDLYRNGRKLGQDIWLNTLSQTKYARLKVSDIDLFECRMISAASSIRASATGKNWCAVGDAAISFDPLSGLGVENAIESGARAASAILNYLTHGECLESYQSWVIKRIAGYLASRQRYYDMEQRWPNSPFWQRRTSKLSDSPAVK